MFERALAMFQRFRWLALTFVFLVAGLGIWKGTSLPLKLSLSDLLPEDTESVRDLNAVSAELGGEGYFTVLLGPMDKPQQYLRPVADVMNKNPDIKYSVFEREEFLLRDKMVYVLPREDFDKILWSVETLFLEPGSNPLDLGLGDESPADKEKEKQEARDFLDSLNKRGGSHDGGRFFLSKDEKWAIVLAKPGFDSGNLEKSAQLLDYARQELPKVLPAGVPYKLVGRYAEKVQDTRQIQEDIKKTSVISMVGVALLLIIGLGSFRAALFNVVLVTVAMAWTLGFARVAVGQINILTGFLLAILGGLGVEYGVHLMRRFYQEKAEGKSREQAFYVTYNQIGRALLSAAITSAAAFLILSFSKFRGFSELGKIAGCGVLFIYIVYMLAFPMMGKWLRGKQRLAGAAEIFAFYPVKKSWKWLLIPFVIVCAWGFSRAEFEYNFRRMRDISQASVDANAKVDELFGKSPIAAGLLAKDREQAFLVAEHYSDPQHKGAVQHVIALPQIVPDDMQERDDALEGFRRYLKTADMKKVERDTGMKGEDIKRWMNAKPHTEADLPVQIRDAFGKSGNIVAVYPAKDVDFADALREFSDLLLDGKKLFPGMKVGSDVTIFTQILDHVTKDGLVILFMFLVGAFFVLWLDFKNFRDALDLELQLICGIILLVCLMGVFGARFSILNIAMMPAVLAAGIDMGVHVRHREEEGYSPLAAARYVAQAVNLSALTTIVGFASLFFAQAGMLKGIAWISVLGQVSMYLICMIFRPLIKELWVTRKGQSTTAKTA